MRLWFFRERDYIHYIKDSSYKDRRDVNQGLNKLFLYSLALLSDSLSAILSITGVLRFMEVPDQEMFVYQKLVIKNPKDIKDVKIKETHLHLNSVLSLPLNFSCLKMSEARISVF